MRLLSFCHFATPPQLGYAKELFELYGAVVCILWRKLTDNRSILQFPCDSMRYWHRLQWQGCQTTAYCSSHLNGIQSTSLSKSVIARLWLDITNIAVADPEGPTVIPKVRNLTRYSANFIHPHYQNIQYRRHVKECIYPGGIRGIATFILNLGARWRWVVNLTHRRF
jgi:hypothetical protein